LNDSEFKTTPLSIVTDPEEWDVYWTEGWKLTADMLLSMGIADLRRV